MTHSIQREIKQQLEKLQVERAKLILSKLNKEFLTGSSCRTWHCSGHSSHSGGSSK